MTEVAFLFEGEVGNVPYITARVVTSVPEGFDLDGVPAALERAVGHDPDDCEEHIDCPVLLCRATVCATVEDALWQACCARPSAGLAPDPDHVVACTAMPDAAAAAFPEWLRPLTQMLTIRRIHAGLSREDLASLSHYDTSAIYRMENLSGPVPSLTLLTAVCAVLGLELSWSVSVPVVGLLPDVQTLGADA